jgi:hypothetical protein
VGGARVQRLAWTAIGVLAPMVVAVVLVPLRDSMLTANVALVLVLVVVAVAASGGRQAGAVAAVASALAFDLVHTRPYWHLRIDSSDDVETTILLLAVGLGVGHLAARGRRARRSAEASSGEIRRIYRVAAQAAKGEDLADVILAGQAELLDLLHLRDCRFEAPPFATRLERLERNGVVPFREYRVREEGFEALDEPLELAVFGRGQLLGRFVLEPTPGTTVSLEERVVAVAIADQVGAVLVAPHPVPRSPQVRDRGPWQEGAAR